MNGVEKQTDNTWISEQVSARMSFKKTLQKEVSEMEV